MSEISPLQIALYLLMLQGLLGAFDTLYHHEFKVDLAHRIGAAKELKIHAVRACLYGLAFAGIAHLQFKGAWIWPVIALVLTEVLLTLWDFVVEDATRLLPTTERITHTVLAINGGALFAFYGAQLWQWQQLDTALVVVHHGFVSLVLDVMALGVFLSGVRDAFAAKRLSKLSCAKQDSDSKQFGAVPNVQSILVTGATGFVGSKLTQQLIDAGHSVTVLTRDPLAAAHQFGARVRCLASVDELSTHERIDAVVHLAGARVLGKRWSAEQRQYLIESRVHTTAAMAAWISKATHKPKVWIQASAIGFYGARAADEVLTEQSAAGKGFMSTLCQAIENGLTPIEAAGVRTVSLRLGIVLGHGGPLAPLAMPFRFFMGGRIGSGTQVVSWIHIDDVLKLIARALSDASMQGAYNAVAPQPLPQADFARAIAKVLHRPYWFHLPQAPLRILMGEMGELLLDGQRVVSKRLQDAGFVFDYPEVEHALTSILG